MEDIASEVKLLEYDKYLVKEGKGGAIDVHWESEFDEATVEGISAQVTLAAIGRYHTETYFTMLCPDEVIVHSAVSGKPNDEEDDDSTEYVAGGPDVDKDKFIAEKTEFERKTFLKFRSLFSEKLAPNRHIDSPPKQISLKQNKKNS